MTKVMIVAPHADDETLGCGGTILRHIAQGDEVYWVIVTSMLESVGYSQAQIDTRQAEIEKVSEMYGFSSVFQLGFPPAKLELIAMGDLIGALSGVIQQIKPEVIYTAYRNDAHSDHQVVFDAVAACNKSFRYPFIRKFLAYETLSETDFGLKPEDGGFKPNYFVNISNYIDKKLSILNVFESEVGEFPFPRSQDALLSLAKVRGVQCGVCAAEAFVMLKEIEK